MSRGKCPTTALSHPTVGDHAGHNQAFYSLCFLTAAVYIDVLLNTPALFDTSLKNCWHSGLSRGKRRGKVFLGPTTFGSPAIAPEIFVTPRVLYTFLT